MSDSNIVLYAVAEFALLLLLICIFLFFHVSSLKKLIRKLEEKIISLRKSIGLSRKETQKALKKLAEKDKIKPLDFLGYLDGEIARTREHHQALNPDRDIVLDIAPDAPMERQALSLRHAFLIAEKEARYAGDNRESSLAVLQSKLQQIIQFYESTQAPKAAEAEPSPTEDEADNQDEIAAYKKRIENLERFKKLFFDMERKWEEARQQADEYHKQLMSMGEELGAGEDFENLLHRYSNAFNEMGDLIIDGVGSDGKKRESHEPDIDNRQPSVGKLVIANQEEIQRLRNMAVDQHKVISELKKQLYATTSAEDKERVVEELSNQLDRYQRFLKEAETCTQLIEDELSRAMQENEQLREQLQSTKAQLPKDSDKDEIQRCEMIVNNLTHESKEMLSTIATLEEENRLLKQEINEANISGPDENTELLKEKLAEMQQELLNLQTQHIELEERYLELKMK
jgi:hypothetical protein